VRKAWATTKLKAHGYKSQWVKGRSNRLSAESLAALKAINLHFHDLRAEFGSRLIESGASLVDARDLLGHSDTKQTDSYLRSRSKSLARAIERKEAHEAQLAAAQKERETANNSHTKPACENLSASIVAVSESAQVVKH